MVARAKEHVDGEAHRGHEQKENNPLRIHCVSLPLSILDLELYVSAAGMDEVTRRCCQQAVEVTGIHCLMSNIIGSHEAGNRVASPSSVGVTFCRVSIPAELDEMLSSPHWSKI